MVEKCDVSRGDWVTALSSCGKAGCRIGKLIPGKEYVFRVRAENRFGISDPLTSERMVAKFPFGKFEMQASAVSVNMQLMTKMVRPICQCLTISFSFRCSWRTFELPHQQSEQGLHVCGLG